MINDISITRQIQCVEREIAMRQKVYPGQVARGRMFQEQADNEIAAMKAVLNTLRLAQRVHLDKPGNQM